MAGFHIERFSNAVENILQKAELRMCLWKTKFMAKRCKVTNGRRKLH